MPDFHVLVLAPLDEEIDALKYSLGAHQQAVLPDGAFVLDFEVEAVDDGPRHIRVVQLKRQGCLHTAAAAMRYIIEVRPLCVVSFGIAAGFVGDDISPEDVLIPDELFYYEPAKESSGPVRKSRRPRQPAATSDRRGRPWAHTPTVQLVMQARKVASSREFPFKVRFGPLASGEKLLAGTMVTSRAALLRIHDKILGAEMEAAGVCAAVEAIADDLPISSFIVKGISDDGSHRKGKGPRAKITRMAAARNAAAFFAAWVQTVRLPRLTTLSPHPTQPPPNSIRITAARENARSIARLFPSFLSDPIDDVPLARALYTSQSLPPIFYHFRVGRGLHWVDYCHLRTLRRFVSRGHTVYPLMTELSSFQDEFKATADLVRVLLRGSEPHWYSQVVERSAEYLSYAAGQGFDFEARETVRSVAHYLGLHDGNLVDEDWIGYIVWCAQAARSCIVVSWERHARIYEQLLRILSLQSVVIPTKSLYLGGELGKFGPPGNMLFIEPPDHPGIITWLEASPSVEDVETLAGYLRDEPNAETTPLRNPDSSLPAAWRRVVENSHESARPSFAALFNALLDVNAHFVESA